MLRGRGAASSEQQEQLHARWPPHLAVARARLPDVVGQLPVTVRLDVGHHAALVHHRLAQRPHHVHQLLLGQPGLGHGEQLVQGHGVGSVTQGGGGVGGGLMRGRPGTCPAATAAAWAGLEATPSPLLTDPTSPQSLWERRQVLRAL